MTVTTPAKLFIITSCIAACIFLAAMSGYGAGLRQQRKIFFEKYYVESYTFLSKDFVCPRGFYLHQTTAIIECLAPGQVPVDLRFAPIL